MKKILSSIILIMTVMLLCCGCSNYNDQQVNVTGLSAVTGVISMKDVKPSETDKSGVFTIKSAEFKGDFGLLITYQFNNKASYSQSFGELLGWGGVDAYQEGVELEGSVIGDININTEVMGESSAEMQVQYRVRNKTDPVTIIAKDDWLLFSGKTYLYKELTLGTVIEENFVESSPYTNQITGASLYNDGKIMVKYSFTNSQGEKITPASVLAVQAFQGNTRLELIEESKKDETHYLKNYYVKNGEKVDLSATFKLANDKEDVTVYLTVPETAKIYAKNVYPIKT